MGTSFYAPRSFANINWQDEALRAFIHEVGDLLQVIYSTVSVLQNSLSAKSSPSRHFSSISGLERRIASNY